MADDLERLIRSVYDRWKSRQKAQSSCPDEEAFAAFLQHTLPEKEERLFKAHIVSCHACAGTLAAHIRAGEPDNLELPEGLAQSSRQLFCAQSAESALQIIVRAKDRFLELLSTNADVLVGQELVPAALLRSRNIRDFPDEVVVLKDFQELLVQVTIRAKEPRRFDVVALVKEKSTQRPAEDLRISLIQDTVELESLVCEAGKVSFEHIEPGKYTVEISGAAERTALVQMEIAV